MPQQDDSFPVVPSQGGPTNFPQLSPDIVQQFVNNQTRELELRTSDLALQQQKENLAFAFGKEALAAKAMDLKDRRRHEGFKMLATFLFVGFLVLLTVFLIVYAVHEGKDAMALEIIKAVIYIGGGAIGGYGIGRVKSSLGTAEINSDDES